MARWLTAADNPLPGYIHITPGGGGKGSSEAAFLGPKYNSLYLGNGHAPANTAQDPALSRAGSRGPAGAADARQRPVRPPPPDRRDRGLHHHL